MSSRIVSAAVLSMAVFACGEAFGQAAAAGGGAGGGLTTTTVTTQQIAGVEIDADGVLRMHKFADPGGRLSRMAIAGAKASLHPEVWRSSEFRKISLNRLEAALQAKLDAGEKVTDEMRYLAGLTRLQYVFYLEDTDDVVIAGPAEGWAADLSGRVRGHDTGQPVLELRDLIVALRMFPPQSASVPVISCSIDPTREGLANMQEFLRQLGGRAVPSQTRLITTGLRKSLGMQKITLNGVPGDTHFAQVLVEADYRMKMIGIGLERTPVKLKAYVDHATPASVARNAMQRWYFVPDYKCVRVTEDELAMELVGRGVKLIGADEMVAADGTRTKSAHADAAGRKFTHGFTTKYEEIASRVPVYAQLRNCVDLAVAAAFIKRQDFYGLAGWSMELFQNEAAYPVQTVSAPERVETVVASIWKRNRLMTPVGGGVEIQPRLALNEENLLVDDAGIVADRHGEVSVRDLAEGQWWWD